MIIIYKGGIQGSNQNKSALGNIECEIHFKALTRMNQP